MDPLAEVSDWLATLAETLSSAQDVDDLEARFLSFAREVVSSRAAGIYVMRPHTLAVESMAAYGVSDFFLTRYEELGRDADPVLQEALARRAAVDNHDLMTDQEWRRSQLYREVLHLHSFDYILQIPVISDGQISGALIFAGADGWTGGPQLRQAATAMGRIIGAGLASVRHRESAERGSNQVVRALDLVDQAIVITDARTGRRQTNRRGCRLLSELKELGIGHFDDLITSPTGPIGVTTVKVPISESPRGELELTVQSVVTEDDLTTTISLLTLRSRHTRDIPEIYGSQLSRRELDVATLVVDGLHDTDIAARLNISPHTAKQYLKSVYRKLGVSSRVDLVRLVLLQALDEADG